MSIENIVFLGDSLSDTGNLYNDTIQFIPNSPPYYNGRFSNGPNWADYVQQYALTKQLTTINLAVGGNTALFHNPLDGFLPYCLGLSKDKYLVEHLGADHSKTLFIIWIGANDYIFGPDLISQVLINNVTQEIINTVKSLILHGAVNFLIINLPDISKTPFGRNIKYTKLLQDTVVFHNFKLALLIDDTQKARPNVNIKLFDVHSIFDTVYADITKYAPNITNIIDSCWTGGLVFGALSNEQVVKDSLSTHLKSKGWFWKLLDFPTYAHDIISSPLLFSAYVIGNYKTTGAIQVTNPEQYLFWDDVHPTTVAHKVIAEMAITFINQNFIT